MGRRTVFASLLVLVVAVGCSSSETADTVTEASAVETTEAPPVVETTEEPAAPEVETAGRPEFDRLIADLEASGACMFVRVGEWGSGVEFRGDSLCVSTASSIMHDNGIIGRNSIAGTYDTVEAALVDSTERGLMVLYRSEDIYGLGVEITHGGYRVADNGHSITEVPADDGDPVTTHMAIDTMAAIEEARNSG